MKLNYFGIFRIAVFSVKVLRDERICVVAEQRPDCTEDESFQWMSRVLQAVDSIHQVGIYCLALVLPNQLPKVQPTLRTKRLFLCGKSLRKLFGQSLTVLIRCHIELCKIRQSPA